MTTQETVNNLLKDIRDKLSQHEKSAWQDALKQLDDAEQHAPGDPEILYLRGCAESKLERPQKALNAFLHASYQRPDDVSLFHYIAKQHARLGHDKAALSALKRCLQLNPKSTKIRRLIAATNFQIGNMEEAENWRKKAVLEQPFFVTNNPGENTKLHVLVLQTAYAGRWGISRKNFQINLSEGHNNLHSLLDAEHVKLMILYIDEVIKHPEIIRKLPHYDVVYNSITDAERGEVALNLVEGVLHKFDKPVINPPRAVLGASREGNYRRFKDHPTLILPLSIKLENVTGHCRDIVQQAIQEHDLALPLIVRVAGYQNGKLMHKVEDLEQHDFSNIDELLAEGPQTLYCIRYHESGLDHPRAPGDRLYPKYRAFLIDGKLYPIHVRFGHGDWNVHMPEHKPTVKRFPWLIDEWERDFFEDPEAMLPKGAWRELEEALKGIGVDYLGVDFGILTEPENADKLVIFEANPAMRNFLDQVDPETPAYQASYRAIHAAHDMFVARANLAPWEYVLHEGQPSEPSANEEAPFPFEWEFTGRAVVLDNAASIPRHPRFRQWVETNTLAIVSFDPLSRVNARDVENIEEFQHIPHALLGDGGQTTLYQTLDETLSAPLSPLPPEQLPESLRDGSRVLARLPAKTVALDNIEGLKSLDWLILDEFSDAATILENGVHALADTLLLQIGVAFSPTHERQPTLAEVSHWASQHGFIFYRLNQPHHRSMLPDRADIEAPQSTQLVSADALFIPDPARRNALSENQCKRLAFILDMAFGIHDLPYRLLAQHDEQLAEDYLRARGYISTPQDGHEEESNAGLEAAL
ncbi:tetratricopeptide repeat protein [Chromohalobacter sp. TMW 2.2308]|uniref:tetratricopeptide repeat protein n=1 Tax=Chromohalobacter TaxID=42054 RepID=UPI001FFD7128|nr:MULTISPECIES: tetratricopeptide repeat protein [Chromohalobacter]MCK2043979.1 tetratricopeptide repeat protein [Chromohalobacter moromii]MCT8515896.1 tetratricopeptide repeat protein [Chromohalobacter sp. TMW 2.2271]